MIEREELERLFREANDQAEAHQYENAISVYRQVITLAGDHDLLAAECAHWGIGEVSLTLGDYSQALDAMVSALTLNPQEAAYHYLIGIVYSYMGAKNEALSALSRANELEPRKPKVLRGYGWTLHRFRHRRRGMKMLKDALSLKPDDPNTLTDLGWAFAVEGRYGEALVCIERARELSPADLWIMSALSSVERCAGVPDPSPFVPATGPYLLSDDDEWDDDYEESLSEGDKGLEDEDIGDEDLEGEEWEEELEDEEGLPDNDWEDLD